MLAQLESKILDLQSQIQATQAQITDYQTNPAYKYEQLEYDLRGFPYTRTINTKTAEIAQAQTTLATLQNELKTTQAQYEQAKEQYTTRAMILNQAFLSAPPPSKIQASQKVLNAIESLQEYLKQKPLYITALARRAVVC